MSVHLYDNTGHCIKPVGYALCSCEVVFKGTTVVKKIQH